MERFTNSAFADSTKKTYRVHRNSYLRFCNRLGYVAVPATSKTLCRYAAFLAKSLKYNSVKQYLNFVRILHAEWDLPNPLENNFPLSCTLRGIRRNLGDAVMRKKPISPDLLKCILSQLNLDCSLDATVWAVNLCMFFGLLRKSNVMPDKFMPDKHLRRCDVNFHQWGVALLLRWSKVNQFQGRNLTIPFARMKGNSLCPVLAIFNSFQLTANASPDGPAFLFKTNGQLKPMTSDVFLRRVRTCLSQAGICPDNISNHSYRRGGATFCYAIGLSAESIKMLGDWKSNCYQRYIDNDFETRLKLVSQMQAAVL